MLYIYGTVLFHIRRSVYVQVIHVAQFLILLTQYSVNRGDSLIESPQLFLMFWSLNSPNHTKDMESTVSASHSVPQCPTAVSGDFQWRLWHNDSVMITKRSMSHYLVITWTLLLILALHTCISWFPSFGVNYQSDSTSELLSRSRKQSDTGKHDSNNTLKAEHHLHVKNFTARKK